MSEYDYHYRAAWGGELPSDRFEEIYFGRDLESAKAFVQMKSVEAGWCEVVTVALPMSGSDLPIGAIMYEHGQQVHADGLMG